MRDLKGKVALITGASSGFGRAAASALSKLGVKLALSALPSSGLDSVAAMVSTETKLIEGDLTEPKQVERFVELAVKHFGRADILLGNAGVFCAGPIIEGDPGVWEKVLQINVSSVFRLLRAVLPQMKEQGAGEIILTSSISGHEAIHGEPVYSASKHAIQAFTHGLRRQLIGTGIKVGAIAPGIAMTNLWGTIDPEEAQRRVKAGEALLAEDIAEAMVFMLTRPDNVTIRDLVILPRDQDI
jgi:ribitol 2-dehydrogenase